MQKAAPQCPASGRRADLANLNEINALERFRDSDSQHTPHFIVAMAQTLVPGIDELSMPGGFLTWTIMTCVPEIRLTPSVFWEELLGQRERIRQAFKTTIK